MTKTKTRRMTKTKTRRMTTEQELNAFLEFGDTQQPSCTVSSGEEQIEVHRLLLSLFKDGERDA